jgi:hypothetical protein
VNKLGSVFVCVLMCNSVVADETDFRCFKSIGLKSPLRLQFVIQADKDKLGYVSYQNGSGAIPVKLLKEKELKKVPGGGPSEFESQWQETTHDGTGGEYVVVSQGALISEFRYIRKKDGKVFQFEEDLDAVTEKGCDWNTK